MNGEFMEVTLQIPDEIARHMTQAGTDLSRRALESFALEEFKSGRITKPELRKLLGFGTRWKLDGFLKSHGVYEDYTLEDFEQERQALLGLGL
jgi:hypothetical protein